jgi:hypothetical protein
MTGFFCFSFILFFKKTFTLHTYTMANFMKINVSIDFCHKVALFCVKFANFKIHFSKTITLTPDRAAPATPKTTRRRRSTGNGSSPSKSSQNAAEGSRNSGEGSRNSGGGSRNSRESSPRTRRVLRLHPDELEEVVRRSGLDAIKLSTYALYASGLLSCYLLRAMLDTASKFCFHKSCPSADGNTIMILPCFTGGFRQFLFRT